MILLSPRIVLKTIAKILLIWIISVSIALISITIIPFHSKTTLQLPLQAIPRTIQDATPIPSQTVQVLQIMPLIIAKKWLELLTHYIGNTIGIVLKHSLMSNKLTIAHNASAINHNSLLSELIAKIKPLNQLQTQLMGLLYLQTQQTTPLLIIAIYLVFHVVLKQSQQLNLYAKNK